MEHFITLHSSLIVPLAMQDSTFKRLFLILGASTALVLGSLIYVESSGVQCTPLASKISPLRPSPSFGARPKLLRCFPRSPRTFRLKPTSVDGPPRIPPTVC